MTSFYFPEDDFTLSEKGFYLLRNSHNYKTIPFTEVSKATIKKASTIKNIVLCSIIAAFLLGFAVYYIIRLYFFFTEPYSFSINVYYVVLPILPGAVGGYLLYQILHKEPIIEIVSQSKLTKLKITKTIKQRKLPELTAYLRKYLPHLEVNL